MQHLCKYTLLAKIVDIIKQKHCNLQKESFQIMVLSDQIFAKQFNNEGIKYLNFFSYLVNYFQQVLLKIKHAEFRGNSFYNIKQCSYVSL